MEANVVPQNLIPFIMNECKNLENVMEICTSLAQKYSLPGAEKMFENSFRSYIQSGNFAEAARICAESPGETLRNIETINLFRGFQGTPQPILVYFQTVMNKCKLNKVESIEIVKPLVSSGRKEIIENWFKEGKFTCSEELGELVKQIDPQLSLKILVDSGSPSAHGKVIEGLVLNRQHDKVFAYCQQFNVQPDYLQILNNVIQQNPEAAQGLAKMICNRQTATYYVDVNKIIEIFYSRKCIKELTQFMVEYLKDNRPEDFSLQTRILEINLFEMPNAAQVLLENNIFSHYDKKKIAGIAERIGLSQIALENYTDIQDIKRVMINVHTIKPTFLIDYFGRLEPEVQVSCLNELLRTNPMQNLQIVVEIAVKYASRIPINELIKLFEVNRSHQGLYFFINRIVNSVDDKEIMFKYIQAGVITNNFTEVQRVIKDYNNFDPERVLEFFLENKLVDTRPIILLCDKFDYIEKLTLYLYKNKQTKVLENYLFGLRPHQTPRVLGTLLDEDCDEGYIKQILNTVRSSCPIEPLVEEFLKRHKLKILQKFLEDREVEGNNNTSLHNALAMIYIDINNNPKDFLVNNKFYDSKIVGKFCEDRDPHLACIAYRRANGACDDEFIAITNKMSLYRLQGQYLVESVNPDLWKKVLDDSNEHKKFVVDQVITVILPQTKNSEEVSTTVKAFIVAGLQGELMELLEKLVLHNSDFAKSASLQNLLIVTAITSAPQKVKAFLTRLDNYDGKELAVKCMESGLNEEAFYIYDKIKDYSNAIEVILRNMDDIKRATIYAEKINTKEVWSKIGRAKLTFGIVEEAIDAFIKSEDAEHYLEVIQQAEREEKYEELIKYLIMARQFKKDKFIDGELVFSYAKCDKLIEIEAFIATTNTAELGSIADRLYDQKHYKACRIIYESVGNNARLASCLVYLKEYQKAILAAKKANQPKCWKEVCFACVKGGEFRLAAQAGSNIIIHPDLVDELISGFEAYGAYSELIQLFEANLSQERNHIYTELAILYAKYNEDKLMDYCRNNYEKFNVPKVIRSCESYQLWNEVVFLHCHYNGHDQAIEVMMNHSSVCFKHDLFTQTLHKVANLSLFNEAIHFYIQELPERVNDMLKVISGRIDLSTTVYEIRKTGYLSLFLPFLKSVQSANNYDVNEALNEVFLEEEDADALKTSILEYASFDQISLAKKIENHQLLELRRISALVYRKNKKFPQSIDISKNLEFYKDAIETAFESENQQICEELLKFFASTSNKECFCSCLYTCYDLIKPDVAMEYAWRYNLNEFLMPYMIQHTKEMQSRLDYVQRKLDENEKKEEKKKEELVDRPLFDNTPNLIMSSGLVPVGIPGMGSGMGTGMGSGMGTGMGSGFYNPGMPSNQGFGYGYGSGYGY
jgi:clathrin heavy chain